MYPADLTVLVWVCMPVPQDLEHTPHGVMGVTVQTEGFDWSSGMSSGMSSGTSSGASSSGAASPNCARIKVGAVVGAGVASLVGAGVGCLVGAAV
jgi:hypothetical protein